MSSKLEVTFGKINPPEKGTVITFAKEGPQYSETATELNETAGDAVTRAAKVMEFRGKSNSSLDIIAPGDTGLTRLIVIGLGQSDKMTNEDWMSLGGRIYAKLGKKDKPVTLIADGDASGGFFPDEGLAELALGMVLRSYSFDKYKTEASLKAAGAKKTNEKVTIQCAEPAKVRKQFARLKSVYEGVFLARDLVNEPSNVLSPGEFAKRAQGLEELGVEVEVLTDKELKKLGMHAMLAVGLGSAHPTCLAVMKWYGGKKKTDTPVGFVGKGVTFDTGGISLKPSAGMEDMKGDMAGAACVTGLMHTLASRKAKVNAIGIIGLVENMPGSNAQRPGDVVTSMSGQTIEVINTDAEGRLVLADAIWYVQEKYNPKFVINLATLTGAVMVALGSEYAGLFSNNDELSGQLLDVSQKTGEKIWRLPLGKKYDKMIDSKIADMKNTGGRYAGSITAAQFLQRYVKSDTPWAHIDIAGTGFGSPKTDVNTSWADGFGVRLLNRLVKDHFEE